MMGEERLKLSTGMRSYLRDIIGRESDIRRLVEVEGGDEAYTGSSEGICIDIEGIRAMCLYNEKLYEINLRNMSG